MRSPQRVVDFNMLLAFRVAHLNALGTQEFAKTRNRTRFIGVPVANHAPQQIVGKEALIPAVSLVVRLGLEPLTTQLVVASIDGNGSTRQSNLHRSH